MLTLDTMYSHLRTKARIAVAPKRSENSNKLLKFASLHPFVFVPKIFSTERPNLANDVFWYSSCRGFQGKLSVLIHPDST
jgi:hypothetical protein